MKPTDSARYRSMFPRVVDILSVPQQGSLRYGGGVSMPQGGSLSKPRVRRPVSLRTARRNRLRWGLVLATGVFTALLAFASIAQTATLPSPQTSNGIEYVTGGFGEDMAQAFKAAESAYPLGLTFAEDAGGGSRPYVADVGVSIKDSSGATILEAPSTGPYFLAKLKPGQYRIDATYQGKTQTLNVKIGEGHPARHVMTWKAQ